METTKNIPNRVRKALIIGIVLGLIIMLASCSKDTNEPDQFDPNTITLNTEHTGVQNDKFVFYIENNGFNDVSVDVDIWYSDGTDVFFNERLNGVELQGNGSVTRVGEVEYFNGLEVESVSIVFEGVKYEIY